MDRARFFELFDVQIQSPKKISVLSHLNPDGDAIGSSLAFAQFLRKFGHEVEVMVPNAFPGFLAWMPGTDGVRVYEKEKEACDTLLQQSDLIALLDYNNESRSGMMSNVLKTLNINTVLIDHHRDPKEEDFYCLLSETEVSSTSELVAEVIFHYGLSYLDASIATNIMVGIMTDTGSFAHSIFHPETFSICAKLQEKSASYNEIHRLVYDNFSENRLRLLGYSISNKMEVLDEYATAIISLSKEELASFNYQVGDTEGIVNFPLSMSKINMAVLVTERQGVVRFSFRSKGTFSVHELANKHFNGGGHTNAAGGNVSCSMESALAMLHDILPEYKELLNPTQNP